MNTSRNGFYDRIRGIAIILVVLGHAIQVSYPNAFDENILFRAIYSFHMSLFMFVSGIVTYKPDRIINAKWLSKRALFLVAPFVAWIIIPFLFNRKWDEFLQFCYKVYVSPDCTYWFLWALFLNCAFLFLIESVARIFHVKRSHFVAIVFVGLLALILHFTGFTYAGLPALRAYCVFYLSGYYLIQYRDKNRKIQVAIGVALALFWLVTVWFWRRTEEASFMPFVRSIVGSSSLGSYISLGTSVAYGVLIRFGGIALVFVAASLFNRLLKENALRKVIESLGQNTMCIYVLQNLFFNIIPINNAGVNMIVNFSIGLLAPFLIAKICGNGVLNIIVFGKKADR